MPLSRVINNISSFISRNKKVALRPKSMQISPLKKKASESSKIDMSLGDGQPINASATNQLESEGDDDDEKSQSEYLSEGYFMVPANDIDADSIQIRIIAEDRLSGGHFAHPESGINRSNAHPSHRGTVQASVEGASEHLNGGARDKENRRSLDRRLSVDF